MNKYEFDYTVFIGRFQPWHVGHHAVLKKALKKSEKLIIIIGSYNQAPSPRNPLSGLEREKIILSALSKDEIDRVVIRFVQDHTYNLQKWIGAIQNTVFNVAHEKWKAGPTSIALIGHKKDESSFYLNLFPTWDSIEVVNIKGLNATDFRNRIYENENINDYVVNDNHKSAIYKAFDGPLVSYLQEEVEYIQNIREEFGLGPFLTVDSIVIQSGYILLVQRKDYGIDQWAIPGGFVELHEKLEDASLRELFEETRLAVPKKVLKGSIEETKIFDDPYRSERSRIITNVFKYVLRDGPLPKVKGNDDAKKARWFTISQVAKMQSEMFEDHYHILEDMVKF